MRYASENGVCCAFDYQRAALGGGGPGAVTRAAGGGTTTDCLPSCHKTTRLANVQTQTKSRDLEEIPSRDAQAIFRPGITK